MGVRSQGKGEEAAKTLRRSFPNAIVSVGIVDMESYDSVRQFAQKCADLPRVDLVILNAALVKVTFTPLPEPQHETIVQVNYLSTVLLAILLLPILKSKKVPGASRPPVLSIVGSDNNVQDRVLAQVGRSHIQTHVDPSDDLINIPNPGPTRNTALAREAPTVLKIVLGIAQFLLGRTPEQGASNYLEPGLVTGAESHGSFVSEWVIRPYPSCWYTPQGQEFGRRLWEETLEELDYAGTSVIIESLKHS